MDGLTLVPKMDDPRQLSRSRKAWKSVPEMDGLTLVPQMDGLRPIYEISGISGP